MANAVEKLNTIAIADIEKVNTLTDDNIEDLNTLEFTGVVPDWKGTRAIIMGGRAMNAAGSTRSAVSVQYKTLASDVNTTDFGDLAAAKHFAIGSGSNGTTVVMGGGVTEDSGGTTSRLVTIDYVTAASIGTTGDAGDLQVGAEQGSNAGASNGTLCFFVGGWTTGDPEVTDRMEQMTISSTSGAATAGDLQGGSTYTSSSSNGDSKFLIIGIGTAYYAKTAVDEHNFDTSADSSAYGNVASIGVTYSGVVCATNRVVVAGGYVSTGPLTMGSRMHYFPVASAADSDSSDSADLAATVVGAAGTSDGTRGEWYGGYAAGAGYYHNRIQKVTIASLSNTSDVGDLTTVDFATDYWEDDGGSDVSGIAYPSVETA